jgi:hypothetical protein
MQVASSAWPLHQLAGDTAGPCAHEKSMTELRWGVKNTTSAPVSGVLELLGSQPLQLQSFALSGGQQKTFTTGLIPGSNVMSAAVGGYEVAKTVHDLKLCETNAGPGKIFVGGSIKGKKGQGLDAKTVKLLEGHNLIVSIRNNQTGERQMIPLKAPYVWMTSVSKDANLKIELFSSKSRIASRPRIYRKRVSTDSYGFNFALRPRDLR